MVVIRSVKKLRFIHFLEESTSKERERKRKEKERLVVGFGIKYGLVVHCCYFYQEKKKRSK